MDNDFEKFKEIFGNNRPEEPEAKKPEEPEANKPEEPVDPDATVVVPAVGRHADSPEKAESGEPGEGEAGGEAGSDAGESAEDESVESRGRKLLEKLDSMLYNPEKHSEDADGVEDDEPPITERDFRPIRPRRDGKIGCLGGLMYCVFCISLSVLLACLAWMAATDVLALNKEEVESTITLPAEIFQYTEEEVEKDDGTVETETVSHADIDYVANALKEAGLIEYKWLFKLFCSVYHADIKVDPGTYTLNTSLDYRALVSNMQTGTASMATTTVTFPEGFTMQEIFERLEENGICSVEDLYAAAAEYSYNYSFLDWAEPGDASRLEGYLFPDTYEFYQGEQASNAINRFLLNFHGKLTADMYAQAEALDITLHQAVIIASMIESEAANDSERARIASVIYNRLAEGMPLQIDATVMYALGEHKEFLTEADLQVDSPYNTYLHTGLPAGPICNPGLASINAALNPESTNYLYYALDTETGEHRFFETYDQFTAFTATQDYTGQ